MLTLTPCGETTVSISIRVDVKPPDVCLCDSRAPHAVQLCAQAVCMCVRVHSLVGGEGREKKGVRHNEMGG